MRAFHIRFKEHDNLAINSLVRASKDKGDYREMNKAIMVSCLFTA